MSIVNGAQIGRQIVLELTRQAILHRTCIFVHFNYSSCIPRALSSGLMAERVFRRSASPQTVPIPRTEERRSGYAPECRITLFASTMYTS